MLIPPVLPAGINLAIAKWTKGQGPRLLRFGSEAVLAPLVLAPLIAPPSSLNLDAWRDELSDFEEREPLLQWLEDGFPTLSTCAPVTLLARNHGSFFQHQADSLKHLREEVAAGRIIDCGPDLPCCPIAAGSVCRTVGNLARCSSSPQVLIISGRCIFKRSYVEMLWVRLRHKL